MGFQAGNGKSGSTANIYTVDTAGLTFVTPSYIKQGNDWMYCNFPEALTAAHLADAGTDMCLNQWTLPGNTRVYISHKNTAGSAIDMVVVIKNISPHSVTFSRKGGMRTSTGQTWSYAVGGVWEDYINGFPTNITLAAGQSETITCAGIGNGETVQGMIEINPPTPSVLQVTVYAVTRGVTPGMSLSMVKYTNAQQYRGCGSHSTVSATWSGALAYSAGVGKITSFASCGQSFGADMIDLTDTENPSLAFDRGQPSPRNNLGNWGVQYDWTFVLTNPTESAQTFKMYCGAGTTNGGANVGVYYPGFGYDWAILSGSQWWEFFAFAAAPGSTNTIHLSVYNLSNSVCPLYFAVKAV